MNSKWNLYIYKLWSPIYDVFFNRGLFLKARRDVFGSLSFKKGQRVLFVGVGTGADFPHVPLSELEVTAIDFSKEMLEKAREKTIGSDINLLVMDAQNMAFPKESFDWVIGSLILSVVPDGEKALNEMVRVAKGDGHILIFDKFTPKGKSLSPFKKIFRPAIRFLGTDIGISFEKILESSKKRVRIKDDKGILFNGMYRKIVLQKVKNHQEHIHWEAAGHK
ncbi:class I SAM-dependent methyltransferase [Bacillus sp. FJAT-27445]|uniref:class I SAM-dependent methyltransferase n=1 Tax=Bacillus sp. FJAT-27445 TaxID=1679166 RepID=UPI0007441220|nr:class I SAM-dependent methyltransferase [Bacillus sp. FJAT-27445]